MKLGIAFNNVLWNCRLNDGRGQEAFEDSFTDLMKAIAEMMQHTADSTLLIQAACLKYIPSTIPDVLLVFKPIKLRWRSEKQSAVFNNWVLKIL